MDPTIRATNGEESDPDGNPSLMLELFQRLFSGTRQSNGNAGPAQNGESEERQAHREEYTGMYS